MKTAHRTILSLFAAVLFVAVHATSHQCQEGYVAEIRCTGYTECRGGRFIDLECPEGRVLDRHDRLCYKVGPGHPACRTTGVCRGKPDGNYPDFEFGCRSFIACASGIFYGRLYCPANLIFNQATNQCDYPNNVRCGNTFYPHWLGGYGNDN